jgi:hypothetical protein
LAAICRAGHNTARLAYRISRVACTARQPTRGGSRNAKFNPGMIHAHEAVSHPGDVYRWARLFGHEGIICLLEQQYGQADLLIEMYKER